MKTSSKRKRCILIVFIVLLLLLIGMCITTAVIMRQNFGRGDYPDPKLSTFHRYERFAEAYPRENVQFQSGDCTLQGYIYGADNDKGLLVFAHGIGTGHETYFGFLTAFIDDGWRVFSYDATGSGNSEGKGTRGLVQSVLDLDAALTFAEQDARLCDLPVCVMGHSWGGFAAAAVLDCGHDIVASVSLAGYAYPVEMLDKGAAGILGNTFAPLFHPFAWGYNKLMFGADAGRNAVDAANSCEVPLFVIHGKDDTMIPCDTIGIYGHRNEITNPNAEFEMIEGEYASHSKILYSDEANTYYAEFKEEYEQIEAQYPDGVPEDVQAEVIAKLDRDLANAPNLELIAEIEAFLEMYL